MRAAGVEVSEECAVPLLEGLSGLLCVVPLRVDEIGNDALDHRLGAAVGVCRAGRALLWDGDHVGEAGGVAVDGSRGREDDIADIVLEHSTEKRNAASDVDAVVFEGDLARFSDRLFVVGRVNSYVPDDCRGGRDAGQTAPGNSRLTFRAAK